LAEYDFILLMIKLVIGVIVVAGITYYVIKPLVKGLSGIEHRVERSRPALNRRRLEEEELEIPTSKNSEPTHREIVRKALEDPIKTTQLVRNWLREKK